jgi:hypothetical protein
MNIINRTNKPLSLPLPGGKKLYLGPGRTGQVTLKALDHPPLAKMLEAGDIEKEEGETQRKEQGGSKAGPTYGPRHDGTGAMRQSGDR